MVEGAPHEYKETPGSCSECGNSPVNHFGQYVGNTLAVWSAEGAYRNAGRARMARVANKVIDAIEQPLFRTIALLPFVRFSRDTNTAATYRSQVIWEEAERRGIQMEQLVICGSGTEIYRARIDGAWRYFQSLPVPDRLKSRHEDWIDDKYLLKKALKEKCVSVPLAFSCVSAEEVVTAFESIGGAVVVKPRSGSRGRHTSVALRSREDLMRAFNSARQLCRHVVVEEYMEGSVCRGTVVGGKLAGFFQAHALSVTGDGTSTIRALLEQANNEKPDRVQSIRVTEEHERFLSRAGLAMDSIVAKDVIVPLTHRTGRLFGGRTRELLGHEHPKLRAYLESAARALEVPVVGFDLIIADPEKDPDGQVWGIIEANSLPYIDLHYLPLTGDPSNVASDVWELWELPMHREGMDASAPRVTIAA